MQWGQIKTLFILCFLILDIFLVRQFIESREAELPFTEETTMEESLAQDIKGVDKLSEEVIEESYLYAKRKQITDEDKSILETYSNQEIAILSGNMIISRFKEPVSINPESEEFMDTISNNVLNGERYAYWGTDDPSDTLIMFQTNQDKPIYYNQSGLLLVGLNDVGEMEFYIQTILANEDDKQENYPLSTELEAALFLYNNTTELSPGDEITIDLGFHGLTALPNGSQVLAPTWKVTINNSRNYFIHAIEGLLLPRDDNSFLRDTIGNILDNLPVTEDNEFIDEIKESLTERMNQQVGVEK